MSSTTMPITEATTSITNFVADETTVVKESKKRGPRRSKDEIAAEKETKAARKQEREQKKAKTDAAKLAKTEAKAARQSKKDAKPKMVNMDGSPIKKNQTAYFLFQAEKRAEVKSELATGSEEASPVKLGAVAKRMGELWKALDEEGKAVYTTAAAADLERYEREVAANPANAAAMEAAKVAKAETKKKVVKVSPTLMRELGLDDTNDHDGTVDFGSAAEEVHMPLLAQKSANQTRAAMVTALTKAREEAVTSQRVWKNATEEVARLQGVLAAMEE